MTGCRHGAKNTLVKNYLYLAEQLGVEVRPLTTVCGLREVPGGWQVETERTGAWFPRPDPRDGHRRAGGARRRHLGDAAAAAPDARRRPAAAPVAAARRADPHQLRVAGGRAVAAARRRLHPRRRDHVVVPPGTGHPRRAGALRPRLERHGPAVGLAHRRRRAAAAVAHLAGRPAARTRVTFLRTLSVRRWSERTIIGLVMQSVDNSLVVSRPSPARPVDADQPAGARRAEPDLDPGRQRGRPPARARSSTATRAGTPPTCSARR